MQLEEDANRAEKLQVEAETPKNGLPWPMESIEGVTISPLWYQNGVGIFLTFGIFFDLAAFRMGERS